MKLANLTIQVNNRYDYIQEMCRDYLVGDEAEADLVAEVTDEELLSTIERHARNYGESLTEAEAEYVLLPYTFYPRLPEYQAFWLHAAVVEMDGAAYAFTAPSGYGKSTHIRLWQKAFGDRVRIINGDNPIIRLENDTYYAYGTPFCGKEGYHENTGVPLKGVCALNHADANSIVAVEPAAAMIRLFRDNWTITENTTLSHLDVYNRFVERIPMYLLNCNQEEAAARVAWNGMTNGVC